MTTARHDIDPRYRQPRRRRNQAGATAVAGALVASGVGGVRTDGTRLRQYESTGPT